MIEHIKAAALGMWQRLTEKTTLTAIVTAATAAATMSPPWSYVVFGFSALLALYQRPE